MSWFSKQNIRRCRAKDKVGINLKEGDLMPIPRHYYRTPTEEEIAMNLKVRREAREKLGL